MLEATPSTRALNTSRPSEATAGRNARYSCTLCERSFNRVDSLKRHHRTHSARHQQERTRRKSCAACIRSKTRCSGQYSKCSRCEHKGLPCLYAVERSRSRQRDTLIENDSRATGFRLDLNSEQDTLRDTGHIGRPDITKNNANVLLDTAYPDENVIIDNEMADVRALADSEDLSPLFWPETVLSQFIGVGDFYPSMLSFDNEETFGNDSFGVQVDLMAANDFVRHAATSQVCQDALQDMRTSTGIYEANLVDPAPVRQLEVPTDTQQGRRHQFVRTSAENAALEGLLEELTLATTAPNGEHEPEYQYLPLVDNPHRQYTSYPNKFSLPITRAATHVRLLKCLRLPLLRSPWQPMTLTVFPSKEQLDHFIDLYFCHFDMLLPMIHRPTYDPNQDLVLTLSMCAIGVLYSGFDEAMTLVEFLSELLRRLLFYLSEQNSSAGRSYSILTAQVLRSILGNSSGSRRLFDFGDDNRGRIVANARAMGLFARHQPAVFSQNMRVQEQWELWVQKERMCRLAWCIHTFDTTATYYRNCRPHLSLAELKMDLPCSKDRWEAETAHAWAALSPWAHGSAPSNLSFQKTLANLLQYSENTSAFRPQTLMSTTLLRMVWDHRESLYSPTLISPSIAGLLKSTSSQQLNILLSGLRNLTTIALQGSALYNNTTEDHDIGNETGSRFAIFHEEQHFRNVILRFRIYLVAQIIATDRISAHMDTEYPHGVTVTRNNVYKVAERNLRSWAMENPSEPRRMARVGAQLLAISRLYPFNLPREPYDIFRAGLLLWTMVPLLRAVEDSREDDQDTAGSVPAQQLRRVCQLDWLGDDNTEEERIIDEWIEHGGDGFALRIHGIPDICAQEGRRQILCYTSDLLRKQHVWGASQSYRHIIQRALQDEPK